MGNNVRRVMLVSRDWVMHRLRNDALRKIAYDELRCNDNGEAAELYFLNQFCYNQKTDTPTNVIN